MASSLFEKEKEACGNWLANRVGKGYVCAAISNMRTHDVVLCAADHNTGPVI